MIRRSTGEAYFKYPKTFSLPSNWQEPGVFFLRVCHTALVTGTTWSLQKEKKKKEKLLHLSSSTNTAWRLLCGDLVTGRRAGRWLTQEQTGSGAPALAFPLSSHCGQGPSALPLLGRLGIDCFYEMNMTQRSIEREQPVHLEGSWAVRPIIKRPNSCFLEDSLNQGTGEQQQTFGRESPHSRPTTLHGKSEKLLSYNYQKKVNKWITCSRYFI